MTIKLIKDLNFAQKLNDVKAVTESGEECLKNYRSYCFNHAATCGLVNNFIKEAQNYSYDSGVMSILESVLNFVNENNISWKLATSCEALSANNSQYGFIARSGVEKVEKLLEMNEADVVSYIKAGVLRDVQFIPEFRGICKEVYGKQINETKSNVSYRVSSPVSYAIVDENKNQTVNINGCIYKINESNVEMLDKCDNERFNRINSHIAGMKVVDESLVYTYRPTYLANENKFIVKENAIEFTNGKVNESFADANKFREYADTLSRTMNITEARQFMAVSNAVAEVFEAMDSIVYVDQAKMFNCANGATVTVIESANNINVTLFNSYGNINETRKYDRMNDAVTEMKKNYNIDVLDEFASRINEDSKKESKEAIAEHKDEIAMRRLKIAELCEQHKNDPIKLAILEKLNLELNEMK